MITAYSSLIREKKRDTLPQWQMNRRGGNEPPSQREAQESLSGCVGEERQNNSSQKFSVHGGLCTVSGLFKLLK